MEDDWASDDGDGLGDISDLPPVDLSTLQISNASPPPDSASPTNATPSLPPAPLPNAWGSSPGSRSNDVRLMKSFRSLPQSVPHPPLHGELASSVRPPGTPSVPFLPPHSTSPTRAPGPAKPSQGVSVFVHNLPYDTMQGEIDTFFRREGFPPVNINILRNSDTNRVVGATIRFEPLVLLQNVLNLNGSMYNGRKLRLRPDDPSRRSQRSYQTNHFIRNGSNHHLQQQNAHAHSSPMLQQPPASQDRRPPRVSENEFRGQQSACDADENLTNFANNRTPFSNPPVSTGRRKLQLKPRTKPMPVLDVDHRAIDMPRGEVVTHQRSQSLTPSTLTPDSSADFNNVVPASTAVQTAPPMPVSHSRNTPGVSPDDQPVPCRPDPLPTSNSPSGSMSLPEAQLHPQPMPQPLSFEQSQSQLPIQNKDGNKDGNKHLHESRPLVKTMMPSLGKLTADQQNSSSSAPPLTPVLSSEDVPGALPQPYVPGSPELTDSSNENDSAAPSLQSGQQQPCHDQSTGNDRPRSDQRSRPDRSAHRRPASERFPSRQPYDRPSSQRQGSHSRQNSLSRQDSHSVPDSRSRQNPHSRQEPKQRPGSRSRNNPRSRQGQQYQRYNHRYVRDSSRGSDRGSDAGRGRGANRGSNRNSTRGKNHGAPRGSFRNTEGWDHHFGVHQNGPKSNNSDVEQHAWKSAKMTSPASRSSQSLKELEKVENSKASFRSANPFAALEDNDTDT